jgi:hypothetical protein
MESSDTIIVVVFFIVVYAAVAIVATTTASFLVQMKPESEYVFHDVRRTHFGTNDGVY